MNENDIEKLSIDVLHYARNTLLVNLRFLDMALSRLKPVANDEIPFGTDGKILAYEPRYLLSRYAQDSCRTVRDYLHSVLHCIFRHNFVGPAIDRELWDICCDMAVESIINELDLPGAEDPRAEEQEESYYWLEGRLKGITAEKLYKYYRDRPKKRHYIEELRELFRSDDHSLWYMPENQKPSAGGGKSQGDDDDDGNGGGEDEQDENGNGDGDSEKDDSDNGGGNNSSGKDPENSRDPGDGQSGPPRDDVPAGSEEDWKNIAERIQVDMESFSKEKGDGAGGMLQNLREVNREKYDYTEFLKKFAVMGEAMKINDDEFDYIFYTYGLSLYGNMPLIEPLEYKEVKRIREFVIAIDTSGSVAGDQVQAFLQKTYNILRQTDSFFSRVNLHIIQCDAQIQDHVKITNSEEFDNYMKTMKIRGLGGTDFRPVFSEVDRLIEEHELGNLKGLIYFTDGYGDFPEKMPRYRTAFVFVEDGYSKHYGTPEVPPWAIKLVLQKDEI